MDSGEGSRLKTANFTSTAPYSLPSHQLPIKPRWIKISQTKFFISEINHASTNDIGYIRKSTINC